MSDNYNQTPQTPPPSAPQYAPYQPAPAKKKLSTKAKVGIGAAAVVGLMIAANAGGSDTESTNTAATTTVVTADGTSIKVTETKTPKLGETIKVKQSNATALVTVGGLNGDGDQTWATKGGTIFEVTATFVCQEGTFKINPYYFEARTNTGTTLNAAIGGTLNSTDCAPGETVTGTVGFEVAPGETISKIILKGVLFNRLADWTV